jgi:hypothetical protein
VNRTTIKIGQESKSEIRPVGFRRGSRVSPRPWCNRHLAGSAIGPIRRNLVRDRYPGRPGSWPAAEGRAPLGRPAAARPSATRLTPTRASRPRRARQHDLPAQVNPDRTGWCWQDSFGELPLAVTRRSPSTWPVSHRAPCPAASVAAGNGSRTGVPSTWPVRVSNLVRVPALLGIGGCQRAYRQQGPALDDFVNRWFTVRQREKRH